MLDDAVEKKRWRINVGVENERCSTTVKSNIIQFNTLLIQFYNTWNTHCRMPYICLHSEVKEVAIESRRRQKKNKNHSIIIKKKKPMSTKILFRSHSAVSILTMIILLFCSLPSESSVSAFQLSNHRMNNKSIRKSSSRSSSLKNNIFHLSNNNQKINDRMFRHPSSITSYLSMSNNEENVSASILNTSTHLAAGSSTEDTDTNNNNIASSVNNDKIYREAIEKTIGTVFVSSLFGILIWYFQGSEPSQEFFAGYIVEQSLSVDNLFVFLLLFDYFKVPLPYQDRVLTWGILGAVVMRLVMISLGGALIHTFKPVLLIFASILLYSSYESLKGLLPFAGENGEGEEEEEDMSENAIVKFSRSLFPTTSNFDGDNFFTMIDGVKTATPLLLCLISVEISDIVFAVDSIPAVFGVTEVSQ